MKKYDFDEKETKMLFTTSHLSLEKRKSIQSLWMVTFDDAM